MYGTQVKERAKGQWYSILRSLGVEDSFLKKRNGPCPLCGGDQGSDRYRWKNTNDRGEYYCTQCGPGDGFQLLMKLHSWTFPETACRIEEFLETACRFEEFLEDGTSNYKPKPKNDPAVAIKRVISESRAIRMGDEVCQYFESRGLCEIPKELLFHPNLYESETGKTFPAMLALVRDVNGVVVSVHRTYVHAGEKAKINSPRKMMSPVGTVNGAAIRLFPASCHVGVAEGIETAIAAHKLFDMPIWSCISANGIATFEPPDGVKEVTVFGDNDKNFTGQRAAYDLAYRLSLKGIKTLVHIPETPGQDWADVLLQKEQVARG